MQKYFKKFVSLVLALSLSVVLSVPALAMSREVRNLGTPRNELSCA
jgi:hypothetical protein